VPQLVKGGKYVFGWSPVDRLGRVVVPPEAREEYGLRASEQLVVLPGSRTSGGFALGSRDVVLGCPLGSPLRQKLETAAVVEGEIIECRGRPYGWVTLHAGCVSFTPPMLERFGVQTGDRLLVVRGSGLALGSAVRGALVQEAARHPELEVFDRERTVSPGR